MLNQDPLTLESRGIGKLRTDVKQLSVVASIPLQVALMVNYRREENGIQDSSV